MHLHRATKRKCEEQYGLAMKDNSQDSHVLERNVHILQWAAVTAFGISYLNLDNPPFEKTFSVISLILAGVNAIAIGAQEYNKSGNMNVIDS